LAQILSLIFYVHEIYVALYSTNGKIQFLIHNCCFWLNRNPFRIHAAENRINGRIGNNQVAAKGENEL